MAAGQVQAQPAVDLSDNLLMHGFVHGHGVDVAMKPPAGSERFMRAVAKMGVAAALAAAQP